MSNTKKLFLLDAMALIYRAHFAFSKNPRINSKGVSTGAVLGFTNSLLEIINKENPSHIGVAFDTSAPTFRHVQFADYKAQREETPEDIRVAIPIVKELVKAFNIPVLEMDGFEADDIIGTLAKKMSKKGFTVYMMTPDKDYAQLVEENIFLYKPAYMGNAVDILGIEEVKEKFGIQHVDQVRDILGLQGDAADNIPGIPGVGAKTAVKFINDYGSLEGLLENIDGLKGKLKEKVEANKGQAILSKMLATIKIDVPITCGEADLEYKGFNEAKLKPIFDELEFRTLAKRVFGATSPAALPDQQLDLFSSAPTQAITVQDDVPEIEEEKEEIKNIYNTIHRYHVVQGLEGLNELKGFLLKQDEFCFDTETTSIVPRNAELVGISFAYVPHEAFYIPVPADREGAGAIMAILKEVFESANIRKIGQNIKYDIIVLKNYGIEVKGEIYDTMLAHYLLDPESRHNMDALALQYLNYEPVSIESLIGKKGSEQGNMRDVPLEKIKEYAAEDADITLQLKEVFDKVIKDESIIKLYKEVENPLVHVLAQMEYEGIRIDEGALASMSKSLEEDIATLESNIYKEAGVEFNIASPKQLGEVLFDKMQLVEKPKKTKSGQYATGEEILVKLAPAHPIVSNILDYRELQKLKSTYVDSLPTMVSQVDQRIHTSYNQAVAATGRLSSTNPNLQNIPIRTEKGKEIRKAFISRNDDYVLMAADYSQIELRIMAAFSGDESMGEAFLQGRDIHSATAAKIYKVDISEVGSDMRRKAKTANFGIIYGISAFGLSQRLDIPRGEAADLIEAYFAEFPAVKAYMDKVINEAREKEYVETIMGRKRYLRDINSKNATMRGFAERNAINAPIQGSAADIIKVAMIKVHNWMAEQNLKSKMILQVHDELVFDVHKDERELMQKNIPEFMKNAIGLSVPMEVEVGFGHNWLEAH